MALVALIEKLKEKRFFELFTVGVRYLIGCAFVISAFGMKKITGSPAEVSQGAAPTHKLSLLFYALASSGFYWKFNTVFPFTVISAPCGEVMTRSCLYKPALLISSISWRIRSTNF